MPGEGPLVTGLDGVQRWIQEEEDWWWVMDGDRWGQWRWNDGGGYGMGWVWEGEEVWLVADRAEMHGGGRWWWRVGNMAQRICRAWHCWDWACQRTFYFG